MPRRMQPPEPQGPLGTRANSPVQPEPIRAYDMVCVYLLDLFLNGD